MKERYTLRLGNEVKSTKSSQLAEILEHNGWKMDGKSYSTFIVPNDVETVVFSQQADTDDSGSFETAAKRRGRPPKNG